MKFINVNEIECLISRINMKSLINKYWECYIQNYSEKPCEITCRFCEGVGFVTDKKFYCTKCHADMEPMSFMMSWHNASFENVIRLFEGMCEKNIYFQPYRQMKDQEHQRLKSVEECQAIMNEILEKIGKKK